MGDDLIQAFTQDLPNVDPGKRLRALAEFARRCPADVLRSIVQGDYRYEFIGSNPRTLGEYVATYNLAEARKGMHLIYLSPYLENTEPEVVLSVVVHEIAHAWLGHGLPGNEGNPMDNNRDADRLASKWGFAREIEIRNRYMPGGQE